MIINFRLFFSESVKKRLHNSSAYLSTLTDQLKEVWDLERDQDFFFGVFNERVRMDKIEFTMWSRPKFEHIIANFDKPWDVVMINVFSHINGIASGSKIEGYFVDIKIDSDTGSVQVCTIDDSYDPPQGIQT